MNYSSKLKISSLAMMACCILNVTAQQKSSTTKAKLLPVNDSKIQYTGRIDKSDSKVYKFSAPGAYIKAQFVGTSCEFDMAAEGNKNYIEIVIDNQAKRILVESERKTYTVAKGLKNGVHTVLICKDTESGMGALLFYGFRCKQLVKLKLPTRKIECYGNSITCGAKMLTGEMCELLPTNWNAPNKAYSSYGAVTARALNAQYHLTSVSGIGLVHSCCNMTNTMPTTYDRLFLEKPDSKKWDFSTYIPDVVTICLGQNDGAEIVTSEKFQNDYVEFVKNLHSKYPSAHFFLLTSPMADSTLFEAMKQSITNVINQLNTQNITKVYKVEMPQNLTHGCESHPNEQEHVIIANVLTQAIKEKLNW